MRCLGGHSADASAEPDDSNMETQKPRSSHGSQGFLPVQHLGNPFGLAATIQPTGWHHFRRDIAEGGCTSVQLRSTRSSKGGACGGLVPVSVIVYSNTLGMLETRASLGDWELTRDSVSESSEMSVYMHPVAPLPPSPTHTGKRRTHGEAAC